MTTIAENTVDTGIDAVEEQIVAEAAAGKKKAKRPFLKMSLSTKKANAGWIFVAPFAIGMLLIYFPIIMDSFLGSFAVVKTNQSAEGEVKVIEYSLKYFADAVDSTYMQNLWTGLQELVLNVPAILIFSLFIAVILNQKMIGRAAFRAIFFIPVILSTGLMESINVDTSNIIGSSTSIDDGSGVTESGLANLFDVEELFGSMAVGTELVEYVVGLVERILEIVNYSGVQMLIFLAGLQSISPSIYEACQIEGATSWETFWKITFPMISPMILVNGIYTIIDSFTRKDNSVMSMIQDTLDNKGWNSPEAATATAQAWLYFGMVLLVIAAFAGFASLFVFYQKRD